MKKQEYKDSLLGTMPDITIAKNTGKHPSWVWRRRNKLNIDKFNRPYTQKYKYNIHSFDEIDNISAYWLGYYFADGNICRVKSRNLVSACSEDKELIDKLLKFYGLKKDQLVYRKKSKSNNKIYYYLQLCSKHLYDRLNQLGCVPKKSNILCPPKIDKKFFKAFLVGLFDGDGSVSLNKSINQWKVSIGTGSLKFANWLKSQLKKYSFGFETRKIKGKNFYNLILCGFSGKCFLSEIYDTVPKDLPLSRKKKIFNKIQSRKGPNFQDWEISILLKNKNNLIKCQNLINKNKKNFGWTRSIDTLRYKVRTILNKNQNLLES